MNTQTQRGPEGLWLACEDMEASAAIVLSKQLAPFEIPIRKCYEGGVQAPTLEGKRHGEIDMLLAALFLKKALNDLRATWMLLRSGYTSQAASVTASLFENALTVTCLAGNSGNAQKVANNKSGDLPWSAQQLAKILAQQWQAEAHIAKNKFDQQDYETMWREIYSGYKWLCMVKHPTYKSAVHDASATSLTGEKYVVMAAPDIRPEDMPVKATILCIGINRVREALRSFVFALECDTTTPAYKSFLERMQEVLSSTKKAFKTSTIQPLPLNIRYTSLAHDWAKLKILSKK